jgi:MFS family permease
MSLLSGSSETSAQETNTPALKRFFVSTFGRLPRNIYLLFLFTTGKGFQLSISALTLNYYVHSLGYQPEFIGLFSAMPALGSLVSAVPVGRLADRLGRKPVLVTTAIFTPLFLALTALVSSAPLLLACGLLQGIVSTAYWVTNLPLLVESSTERQRVGVLAVNSFLLLGVGALGNLLGGAIPEFMAGVLHVSAASTIPLRWGVFTAALFTFIFGLPLWFLREPRHARRSVSAAQSSSGAKVDITGEASLAVAETSAETANPAASAVADENASETAILATSTDSAQASGAVVSQVASASSAEAIGNAEASGAVVSQVASASSAEAIGNAEASGVVPSQVASASSAEAIGNAELEERLPVRLFIQLLIPDLVFTMGEGAVVALIQIYFVLRFHLLPGPLGIIFTISGLAGGLFSLTAPLFVKRWSKLRLVTTVQYLSAPLMVLIGFAPTLPFAIAGEYTRSFMRTLIEPVYAAFAMEKVSDRHRATLSGLYSVTWSIGFSAGPAIGGWLQTNVSLSASFVFGALCLLIAPTFLLANFGRRARRVEGS